MTEPLREDFADGRPLWDAHRATERWLGAVSTLARNRRGLALAARQRHALSSALGFFTRDWPSLREHEEGWLHALCAAGLVQRTQIDHLIEEHRATERALAVTARLAASWLRNGTLSDADARELHSVMIELQEVARPHLAAEDALLEAHGGLVSTVGAHVIPGV